MARSSSRHAARATRKERVRSGRRRRPARGEEPRLRGARDAWAGSERSARRSVEADAVVRARWNRRLHLVLASVRERVEPHGRSAQRAVLEIAYFADRGRRRPANGGRAAVRHSGLRAPRCSQVRVQRCGVCAVRSRGRDPHRRTVWRSTSRSFRRTSRPPKRPACSRPRRRAPSRSA